ncbi:mechanosensitive ion channel [Rubrobacter marinus]|uniref:Mechanosensitive ion channel n=1 Tax=Rubrobacter marinus TaxID=2653852 RepID=A0A6G8Q120_9ACTN|nr:mechanosensitive ion channel family protein [Rubrobacter marinus]QIN80189.1 mechanosensitive ion channel [Rubrobacter marinus]
MDTLEKILADLGGAATEFVPRLVGAVVVMLVALVVALLLQRLANRLLDALGLDDLFDQTGASASLSQLGYDGGPSRLLGQVLFAGTILTGLAGALSVLGIASLEQTIDQLVNLSGRALVALVILIGGIMLAGWLSEFVAREAEGAGLRGVRIFQRVAFVTVLTISGLVAASQLGLETSVLVLFAIVIFSTIGLVTAIALGGGLVTLSSNIAASSYVREGINVGDEISLGEIEGRVEEVGRAAVVLRSEDGYLYRIPNNALLEGIVRKRAG